MSHTHGERKGNWRIESAMETKNFVQMDTGEPIIVSYTGAVQSGEDRWCAVCNDWRPAMGIMGAILCPTCATPWDEDIRQVDPIEITTAEQAHADAYYAELERQQALAVYAENQQLRAICKEIPIDALEAMLPHLKAPEWAVAKLVEFLDKCHKADAY